MRKYVVYMGTPTDLELALADDYPDYRVEHTSSHTEDATAIGGTVTKVVAVLRLRSEETEPDPEDDWCLGKAKDGTRCLLDSTRDGLCKRHWREATAQGLL